MLSHLIFYGISNYDRVNRSLLFTILFIKNDISSSWNVDKGFFIYWHLFLKSLNRPVYEA